MTEDGIKKFRTTTWSAGPGCHGGCGVIAHIKDNKLIKIEGDPDHPWSHGRLCARVLAMTQYVENEKRLRKPLKRVGKRGEGKWQEISWDEAFDLIETKMKKIRDEYGPESVIFAMGTGRDIGAWICMLAYAFGSPNVMFALSGNSCYSPRIAAIDAVQGDFTVFDAAQWHPDRYNDPRWKAPEVMIIWGYNIHGTCPDNLFGHWIIDLMKKGTKLIVIDPRLSWFASRSNHWLQIRPGTDSALAMGFLNVIINENLYERDFLKKWTNGTHLIRKDTNKLLRECDIVKDGSTGNFVVWDQAERKAVIWESAEASYKCVCKEPMVSGECTVKLIDGREVTCRTAWDIYVDEVNKYSPEKVSEITGIKADDLIKAARFYANAKPGAIHWGVPIDMTPAVTPLCQAIAAMWALTGNLDIPGGNVISKYAFDVVAYALPGADGAIKLRHAEMDEPRIGKKRYMPFDKFCWRCQTDVTIEQVFSEKPYPIKGMWFQTCNPLAGIGLEPEKWQKAMEKMDFVAVVDLFHTPTTQYADVVLPAATFLEKDSFRSWWVPLQAIKRVMKVDECMSDIDINFELSKRFDPEFEFKNVDELFNYILKPSGMTFEELKEKGYAIPTEGMPSAPYNRYQKGLLRPDGKPGFKTPTGLFELYATLREEWDLEPVPHHEEPPFTPQSRPDLAKDYPLILSTGRRSPAFFHTEHRMIPWLRNIDPDPLVEINPETARKQGIGNGEWVWVENWLGKAKFKAKLTLVVPEWMVMATHGWWFPEKDGAEPSLYGVREHNINNLLPMNAQGKDGMGAPIKHSMCRIYKADGKEK